MTKPLFILLLSVSVLLVGCSQNTTTTEPRVEAPVADSFAYPVGDGEAVTKARDGDGWFVKPAFGEDDHLGDDWDSIDGSEQDESAKARRKLGKTQDAGGNADCFAPIYAAANGVVVFAGDGGFDWGNVIILEHTLPSGQKVQTLYGHLLEMTVKVGDVAKKRQEIGAMGNVNGRVFCHLHFEVREPASSAWGRPGELRSTDRKGWLDPSAFIDAHR